MGLRRQPSPSQGGEPLKGDDEAAGEARPVLRVPQVREPEALRTPFHPGVGLLSIHHLGSLGWPRRPRR
jgi:hypothetical protein